MTPQDVFNEMEQRFRDLEPVNIKGVFQFDISGSGGGQWHAECDGATCRVGRGPAVRPDVVVSTNAKNVVKLAEGRLSPAMALLTRRVKLKGNLALAAKVQGILTDRLKL